MVENRHVRRLIENAPQGEHFLYTDMKSALSGYTTTAEARVAVSGCGGVTTTENTQDDATLEAIVDMTATSGSATLYLDTLANVSMARTTTISAASGRTEVSIEGQGEGAMSFCRLVVNVSKGAEAEVVVRLSSVGMLIVQAVVNVPDDSRLSLLYLQTEADRDRLMTKTTLEMGRYSNVDLKLVNLRPLTARNEVCVALRGEGAELKMDGLYVVEGGGRIDTQTKVEHGAPHAVSSQLFKGIAGREAVVAFGGLIEVMDDMQKTQASQTNRHMLAHPTGRAYAKPQLKIFADDVKCSHGATTGQIDPFQLFYLQQRGIDEATARRLLSAAFLNEVVDKIAQEDIRQEIATLLTE